ncbi:MAG: MarR family transcriptional regulator, partial [Bacteroidota bacterium]
MNQNPETLQIPGYRDWFEVIRTYAACERVLTDRCRDVGLTLAQHDVLAALSTDGPLRQNELASRLFVTKSNVTALLARMERDGLVRRAPDPDD